ncbi:hypothetical protein EDB85DRAFT_1988586 [Lactarius pseudohatsudake]|nr:hypothetical protein EDB85DRAFT_1988586 [Lactarius pseudohatsudake]
MGEFRPLRCMNEGYFCAWCARRRSRWRSQYGTLSCVFSLTYISFVFGSFSGLYSCSRIASIKFRFTPVLLTISLPRCFFCFSFAASLAGTVHPAATFFIVYPAASA